jgi:ABC-type multidrug transport system fused ATPase/permease subunit
MKSARFFWCYVTYRKDRLMTLLGCALVTAAAELTMPWLPRQAIDTVLGEMSGTSLEALGLWMIGVIVLLYIAHMALLRVKPVWSTRLHMTCGDACIHISIVRPSPFSSATAPAN